MNRRTNKLKPNLAKPEPMQPTKKPKKKKRFPKWLKITLLVLVALVLILGVLAGLSVNPAKSAYASALSGKEKIQKVPELLEEQKFDEAAELIESAKKDFEESNESFKKLSWVKVIPYARRQYVAADHLFKGAMQITSSVETAISVAQNIMDPLGENGEVTSFKGMSPEQKGEILKQLKQSAPELERSLSQFELAEVEFSQIPEDGVVTQISEARDLIGESLPDAKKYLKDIVVISKLFPALAGYPNEQTYLLLFQNNTELRPSGGFLGSYGIVKVKDAEMLEFTTHDVYGLDQKADIEVDPPWQIKKLAAPFNKSWYMRDANWSPDFAESSKEVMNFYALEGGTETFDGVVGITPDFISFLLEITGPTQIPGYPYTFTKDNVTEQLEFHVEKNFVDKGIDFHERKDIISDLAAVLLGKVMTLPREKWMTMADVVQRSLMEKHLVMYMENPDIQKFLVDKNWAGTVQDVPGDYMMVVDSNMASLKTDEFIERQYEYTLDATGDKPRVEAHLTYKNTAPGFTWKTTRYRNWNRIYVPEGSEFLGVEGNEKSGEYYIDPANPYEVTQELGKTSFGTFVTIEPGEQRELTYSYDVPVTIFGDDNEYTLYFQKQIGQKKPKIRANLTFKKPIASFEPAEYGTLVSDNVVEFNADLQIDREFKVTFK
ncbi:DUF4012 domain-containing protein [Patescibacteria group bacterium]|nr:DUF4012 domain-containing protein [Patescibacteria group bacterium]